MEINIKSFIYNNQKSMKKQFQNPMIKVITIDPEELICDSDVDRTPVKPGEYAPEDGN